MTTPHATPTAPTSAAWWLLPLLVSLALYLPPCFDAAYISDDWPLLAHHKNPGDILGEWQVSTHLHAAERAGGYLWRPLTASLHQVVGELFGRSPTSFRLLNLGLHLLVLGLCGATLRAQGATTRGAALLLLAFAVHPLLPDAVCWMSDTYDLLAAALLLGALRLCLADRLGVGLRALGAGALFLLALLSKESSLAWAAALPWALLLLRGWRLAAPVGAVGAVVALGHARWHEAIVGTFGKSAADLVVLPDLVGVWTQYLGWPLTMPVRAGFTHLVEPGQEPVGLVGLALLVGGTVAAALAERRGDRAGRHLLAALGTWVCLLSPVALAAIAFGQQSSRYLYMPLVLSVALLGGLRLPLRPRLLAGLVLAWTLAWLPATWSRVGDWQSETALYESELLFEPDNALALYNVGRLRVAAGQVEEGLHAWERALTDPPVSSFVMDLQQQRLSFAEAALRAGQPRRARVQLDAFLRGEEEAGVPVHPSILALSAQIDAALAPPAPAPTPPAPTPPASP